VTEEAAQQFFGAAASSCNRHQNENIHTRAGAGLERASRRRSAITSKVNRSS
jgi:hypothetical protein